MKDFYKDHRKYFALQESDGRDIKRTFDIQGDEIIEYRYDGEKIDKVMFDLLSYIIQNTEILKNRLDYFTDRRKYGYDWITHDLNDTLGVYLRYGSKYAGEKTGCFSAGHGCEHDVKDVYVESYTPYTFPIHLFYIYELMNLFCGRSYLEEKKLPYNKEILNKLISKINVNETISKDYVTFLSKIKYSEAFEVNYELTPYTGEYGDCSSNKKEIYLPKRIALGRIRFKTVKDLLYFAYDLINDYTFDPIKNKILEYLESDVNYDEINIKDIENLRDEFLIKLLERVKEESQWFDFYREINEHIESIINNKNKTLARIA